MIFQWALQSLLRLRRLCAVTPSAWVMLELKIKRQVIVAFWQVVVVGGVFLGMSSYCLIVWFKSAAGPDWLAGALLRNNAGTKTRHRAYFMSSSHSWLIIFQNVSTVPDLNSVCRAACQRHSELVKGVCLKCCWSTEPSLVHFDLTECGFVVFAEFRFYSCVKQSMNNSRVTMSHRYV